MGFRMLNMDKKKAHDFAARLRERMADLGVRQKDIMKVTGKTSGAVSSWVNGNYMPKGEALTAIAKLLKTSQEWLLTGQGPKDIPNYARPAIAPESLPRQTEPTPEQLDFTLIYQALRARTERLPAPARRAVAEMLSEALTSEQDTDIPRYIEKLLEEADREDTDESVSDSSHRDQP